MVAQQLGSMPIQPGWLLHLPLDLERQFFQEPSVQQVYAVLDAVSPTQALVFNWHAVAKLAHTKGDCVLQPHELVFFVGCFVCGLIQMVYMFARPQQYKAHRQTISFINRMLRLALTVTSAVRASPAETRRAVEAWQAAAASNKAAANSRAWLAQHKSMASTAASGACDTASQGLTTPAETGSADLALLARGILMEPVFGMLYANFLVPFRFAVPIQFASFLASAWRHLAPVCAAALYVDASAAAAFLPLCHKANWLIYAAAQLLDWHFPVSSEWLSTAADELCRQPLAVLVLIKVWVRVILWLLVPCALLYCLERSLKQTFLERYAVNVDASGSPSAIQRTMSVPVRFGSPTHSTGEQHLSAAYRTNSHMQPAPSGVQQGSSSSLHPVTQSQQSRQAGQLVGLQNLEQTLQAVQPAPLCDLLQPDGLVGSVLRFVLSVGGVLCVVLVSWWVCELGVIAVMHRREFVCDAEGWLRLE